MSGYTMTQTEELYAYSAVGTQLNTFTTEANLMGAYPLCPIPVGYFNTLGGMSKSMRVKAVCRLGTTGAPTFTWTVRFIASTTWSAGGISLGSTAALTAGTTQTLAPVFIDLDIMARVVEVAGATTPTLGTVACIGEVRSPLGLASPFAGTIPGNNVTPTNTSYDASAQYYLFLSAACGTSNVANLIQLEMLKVFGEN